MKFLGPPQQEDNITASAVAPSFKTLPKSPGTEYNNTYVIPGGVGGGGKSAGF